MMKILPLKENIFRIKELMGIHPLKKEIITENNIAGKTIINVDIQPEYEEFFLFKTNEWINFLNNNVTLNKIIFLYNGKDTLDMISEYDYKSWLFDYGLDEDIINNSIFFDKGYAFFRYCMDSNIDHTSIVDIVKFMINHNINDSRDMDEGMWNKFMEETNHTKKDVRELLEYSQDMINIPDLMDFLKNYSDIVLLGGGMDECLKEVEIALMVLNKPYKLYQKFIY